MRKLLLLIFSCFTLHATAQQATIFGSASTQPGFYEYYEVSFDLGLNGFTTITWNVTGGVILEQITDPLEPIIYCWVQWDNNNTIGTVEVSESWDGQSGVLNVVVGSLTISPAFQDVGYNTIPQNICVDNAFLIPNATFQWQIADGSNWSNVTGTSACYSPPVPTEPAVYRCIVTIDGVDYFTDLAIVDIDPLQPGMIGLTSPPAYNAQPAISQTPANGGNCLPASYQYTWQQSIEGGPWEDIGSTEVYPVNAPPIIGNTLVRRKIICGSETMYTNTLQVIPSYIAVDYENRNYVREYTISTREIYSLPQADQLEIGKKFQQTKYFDGLGRTIQVIDKGISGAPNNNWNDLVSFTTYDNLGRSPYQYLPWPTSNEPGKFKTSTASQVTFYSTNYNETDPKGKIEFENNPLGRVIKTIEPGAYRLTNDIGKSIDYNFNTAAENVRIWYVGTVDPQELPGSQANYQTGTLLKTVVEDEHGKKTIEYKDLKGNIVLKKVQLLEEGSGLTEAHDGWLCTYYVYDDFSRLRYIITPKAVSYLDDNNWQFTGDIANELCFSYQYDRRGRTVVKKTPGATPLQMVYDQRDRLIYTQDGNQANKSPKEWVVYFYDELDRVTSTGIYKSNKSRYQLQQELDNAAVTTLVIIPTGAELTNLVVSERETVNPPYVYVASEEVVLLPGFESLPGDEFVVEIDPVDKYTIAVTDVATVPVNVNDPAQFTSLTYKYYDDYSYTGTKAFDNTYSNTDAYQETEPDVEPIAKSNRTLGMVTGSKVRVLGTETFLITTLYYDEEGSLVQSLGDNYKNGVDIVTNQYHFDGRLLSTYTKHGVPGGDFDGLGILTKNEYDKIGRLKTISKKFGTAAWKKIVEYAYDELGHLLSRSIGKKPSSNDPLETFTYSYNAVGGLIGINQDYALSSLDTDQWDNYFGMHLGYENFDSRFAKARYDNLITGMIWKSQGDNTPRKYDYDYDNAGRFTAALFSQKSVPSAGAWSNTQYDFSVLDVLYDENGNLKRLYRKGVVPGSAPLFVDKLDYYYKQVEGGEWSNQLLRVFDNGPGLTATTNGKLGDFKDEVYNTNTDDYTYDFNGNLVKDHNKLIRDGSTDGITYNFLDKPEKIVIENKSTVEFIYDATGIKLAKKVTPVGGTTQTTYYIGEFVYLENDLQFILHEEGRLRIMTPQNSTTPLGAAALITNGNVEMLTGKWGVFEYFIKDHLGSVRMVLTEEYHKEIYACSMEESAASEEAPIFGKVDNQGNPAGDNEVNQTRHSADAWESNSSEWASRLITTNSSTEESIGPNVLLKVMAGDYLSATTNYYYEAPVSTINNNNILQAIVSSIIGGFAGSGASQAIKDNAVFIQSGLENPAGPLMSFLNNRPAQQTDRPKAYLNYIFFDENFNYVSTGSGAAVVLPNNNDYFLTVSNIQAPKNGYAYVYLSNESDIEVLFDDFVVTHERGAIVEESHYYPHGLKIASISSRAYNKLPNKYGFQGEFSEEEEESGYDQFDLRMYDPQTGRWIQGDPYDQYSSRYIGMGNNPVNNVDPNGGWTAGGWGSIIGGALFGIGANILINTFEKDDDMSDLEKGGIIGLSTLLGAGIGYSFGATFIDVNLGTFGQNFRGFYVGLVGAYDPYITASRANKNWNVASTRAYYSIPSPKIWNFGKISMPDLFDWVPSSHIKSKLIWTFASPTSGAGVEKSEISVLGEKFYNLTVQVNIPEVPNSTTKITILTEDGISNGTLSTDQSNGTETINKTTDRDITGVHTVRVQLKHHLPYLIKFVRRNLAATDVYRVTTNENAVSNFDHFKYPNASFFIRQYKSFTVRYEFLKVVGVKLKLIKRKRKVE